MTKKLAAFRIEPEVQSELRALSAKHGMPIGEIIDGLIRFAAKTQGSTILETLPAKIRDLFQFIIEGSLNTAMSEAREAARQAKIERLTASEQAAIMARHEEQEKKARDAYKAAGLPWPGEEEE